MQSVWGGDFRNRAKTLIMPSILQYFSTSVYRSELKTQEWSNTVVVLYTPCAHVQRIKHWLCLSVCQFVSPMRNFKSVHLLINPYSFTIPIET